MRFVETGEPFSTRRLSKHIESRTIFVRTHSGPITGSSFTFARAKPQEGPIAQPSIAISQE